MLNKCMSSEDDKCIYSHMRQTRGLESKDDEQKMMEAVRSQPEYIYYVVLNKVHTYKHMDMLKSAL